MKPPRLDARDYEALRESLIRRIAVHAPEWTDHNPADPGIAILELFAHLGEELIDQINRVPSASQVEFLKLLGVPLRPAEPAKGLVRISLRGGLTSRSIEPPTIARSRVSAGSIDFELQHGLDLLPVEVAGFVKGTTDASLDEIDGIEHMTQVLEDKLGGFDSDVALSTYETVPLEPVADGQAPASVSLYQTTDHALWIAVLAPEDEVESIETLRSNIAGKAISLAVGIDPGRCGGDGLAMAGDSEVDEPMRWQVATGRFRHPDKPHPEELLWEPVRPDADDTRGLRYTGRVELRLPDELGRWFFDDEDVDGDIPALDRSLRGVGDLPPALDDEDLEARVITWIRCYRTSTDHPMVRWVDVNMAQVRQALTGRRTVIGLGDGNPYQRFELPQSPVLPDTVELQIKIHGTRWTPCKRVQEFVASGPDDLHFVLDSVSGVIRTGDGVHGHIPQPGEALRVVSFERCDGEAGNVGAGAISQVSHLEGVNASAVEVKNILAMTGGRDPETLTEARGRIPSHLRHRERAVAAADFADLAMETPGVCCARAEVLPRFKPFERAFEVPGAVTVVVLPSYDAEHPDEPSPDQSFLRQVCAFLDPRRLVTTEVYVIGPEYVPLSASVAIDVASGYSRSAVERWVELTVRQYLAPLPPYGPAGGGWPLGRMVRAADLHAAAVKVEGVRLVHDVRLQDATGTRVDSVALERWQLPSLRALDVVEAEEAPPVDPLGEGKLPDAPEAPSVSVPVHREEC